MLVIANLCKSYGSKTLFEEACFQVIRGERLGVVGPNGAGKSTLFQIILGAEQADSGEVTFERGCRVGYLPQESLPVQNETVLELATTGRTRFDSASDGPGIDHHEPEDYQLTVRAKRILKGLSFREKDFDRPARELSGGWIMRAHLARLLVQEPDLLMLDEPTNHLDLESLIWLQGYLEHYPGGILMISHDREFLNRLTLGIAELRGGRVYRYRGNYDSYLEQKEAFEEQQLAAYKSQQREIERLMRFVERFRAKNTKAAQAQSKLKQVERMDKIEAPEDLSQQIKFRFPQPERSGLKVITLSGIHHAYGANVVYAGMDFEAERGQRIVLVGPNGAGKSTLLKLLAEVIPPQQGTRTLGHKVKFGYFAQHRVEMLQAGRTVFEEACDTPQRVTEEFIRTVLGCFLFRGDDVFKPVRVLSGGEKTRLALVKLLLDPPNLLLMDEPTTHLDMASIDALIYAMDQFEGTLIFISHDVHFIRSLANHVVHVQGGRLTPYPGGYDYYLDKRKAITPSLPAPSASDAEQLPAKTPGKSKEERKRQAEERQAWLKERRETQRLVEALEGRIADAEKRQTELTEELQRPEAHSLGGKAFELGQELAALEKQLAALTEEWAQAAERLAGFGEP
ncbi:MAG: ABC-F family ATP-binding cassette domain-containing protein [Verrucomicrobia bacterium]|nr:ABC-F family ATP-binding cassette domain-containing protein [Verrucomicrobiota bacterium]